MDHDLTLRDIAELYTVCYVLEYSKDNWKTGRQCSPSFLLDDVVDQYRKMDKSCQKRIRIYSAKLEKSDKFVDSDRIDDTIIMLKEQEFLKKIFD